VIRISVIRISAFADEISPDLETQVAISQQAQEGQQ
jgi:hypothetical protein